MIAGFVCQVADSSDRPKSELSTSQAAIGCMMDALGVPRAISSTYISKRVDGLIKSATLRPMVKTPVMPVDPFLNLFLRWEDNDNLSTKDLRLKAICLLALVLMLWPSDIAPRGRYMNPATMVVEQVIFGEDQVIFHNDGSLTLAFHDIKNDYNRDGFSVTIPAASAAKIDPVRSLQAYMQRTASLPQGLPGKPVFISLIRPYHPLSAKGVATVLQDAIVLAELKDCGYMPSVSVQPLPLGLLPVVFNQPQLVILGAGTMQRSLRNIMYTLRFLFPTQTMYYTVKDKIVMFPCLGLLLNVTY